MRILAFDLENKPGTYGPGDFTHGKVTALGAQFVDEDECHGWVLKRDKPAQMKKCVREFRDLWNDADIVLGHNIRRHDVRLLNGLCTSLNLPLLPERRMIDTYSDQPKMSGLSRSLENLCDRWDCPEAKLHLSEADWEAAYDGRPEGEQKMLDRVTSDVRISIWLYRELLRRQLLRAA
jgi:hypothetical protein